MLVTQEAEIRRIVFQSQPEQKVCETSSQQKRLGTISCTAIPATQGTINRRIMIQAGLAKKQYPISIITTARRAGGVAHAYQASNHEALNSTSSTTKKKKK
jgi:hypothetical protein